ncbi:MAG TPA: hypothetical protein VK988_19745, partial [Acidimicrobiales bacterium]|nr:hypothetical protein [Acidimicrobiales bacterium]
MPDEIRRSEDDPEQAGGVGRRRQAALECFEGAVELPRQSIKPWASSVRPTIHTTMNTAQHASVST